MILFYSRFLLFVLSILMANVSHGQISLSKIIKHGSTDKTYSFDYDDNDRIVHMNILDELDTVNLDVIYDDYQYAEIHVSFQNTPQRNFDLYFYYNEMNQIDSIVHEKTQDQSYYLLSYSNQGLENVSRYWKFDDALHLGYERKYTYQGGQLRDFIQYEYYSSEPWDYSGYSYQYFYDDQNKKIRDNFSYFVGLSEYKRHYHYSEQEFLIKTDYSSYNGGGELTNQIIEVYEIDENVEFNNIIHPLELFDVISIKSFTSLAKELEAFQIILSDRLVTEVNNEYGNQVYSFEYENYEPLIINTEEISKENSLETYPNPAGQNLYFSEGLDFCKVLDRQGQIKIFSKRTNQLSLEIHHLTTGLYYLTGYNQQGKMVQSQFVKF